MSYKSVIENIYVPLANGGQKPIFDVLATDALWIESENLPNVPEGQIVGHESIRKAVFESALAEHWAELRVNPVRIVEVGTTMLEESRNVGITKSGTNSTRFSRTYGTSTET